MNEGTELKETNVLVLGCTGMLGHRVFMEFANQGFNVSGTMRSGLKEYDKYDFFNPQSVVEFLDPVNHFSGILEAVEQFDPSVIINCIGKTKPHTKDPVATIETNSVLPHKLARFCDEFGIKLIHITTDCVWTGKKGDYGLSDPHDATDLYGKSKSLGEVAYGNHLTVRTSIIGRELNSRDNLLEWILSQPGDSVLSGFTEHLWNGVTTMELANILVRIVDDEPELKGIIQIAGEKINKYDLLNLVKDVYHLNFKVEPKQTEKCDRTMINTSGHTPPSIRQMLEEFYGQEELYKK
jgi:dTDP-4-dehydrorhamnose reductase